MGEGENYRICRTRVSNREAPTLSSHLDMPVKAMASTPPTPKRKTMGRSPLADIKPTPAKMCRTMSEVSASADCGARSALVHAQGHVPAEMVEPASDGEDAEKYMERVVYEVKQQLQSCSELLGVPTTDGDLWKLPPLTISSTGEASSYKHPWDVGSAKESLAASGLYEAAGSIFWCSVRRPADSDDPPATMAEVKRCANQFVLAALGAGSPDRITFPVVVPITMHEIGEADRTAFDGTLQVLTGHAFLYGWWYAIHEALASTQGNDAPDDAAKRVKQLMECARTVTLHARMGLSESQAARWSISLSEVRKADNELCDTFVTFSKKAWKALGELATSGLGLQARIERLGDLKVRFGGAVVSKQMMTAIQHLNSPASFNATAFAALRKIDVSHGPAALSGSYTKLVRLAQIASKETNWCGLDLPGCVAYFLQWLSYALSFEFVTPSEITVEWLEVRQSQQDRHTKRKQGGCQSAPQSSPGAFRRCLAKHWLVHSLLSGWIEDLSASKAAISAVEECKNVLQLFTDFNRFQEVFSPGGKESAAGSSDLLEQRKDSFKSSVAKLAADFCYDLFSSEHDALLDETLGAESCDAIDWIAQEAHWIQLKELSKQLNLHKTLVSSTADIVPPPQSARTLRRLASEATDEGTSSEAQKERAAVWKTACDRRKKLPTSLLCILGRKRT
jgi:hypothetical protein